MLFLSSRSTPRIGLVIFFANLSALCFAAGSSSSSLALPSSVATSTPIDNPSSTTSSVAQTHTVSVGNGDHKFRPDVTQANVGDIIEFQFYPANHSVVRAEYKFPCIPYEMTGTDKVGFFSGFHPVDAVLPNPPQYQLKINTTDPIFFYCSAPGSCITYGMVGVINPNATTSLALQRSLAESSGYMLNPGEPFPAEGTVPSSSPDPNPTSATEAKNGRHGLGGGAIAGIVVGAISVVVLGGALFFFIGRSRSLNQEIERKSSTIRHNHNQSMAMSPSSAHAFYPQGPNAAYFSPNKVDSAVDFGAAGVAMGRAGSHRSVGGTFTLSPTTGYYTRTHEAEDTYKYTAPNTRDSTSSNSHAQHHGWEHPWPGQTKGNGNWNGGSAHGTSPQSPNRRAVIPDSPVEIGGTEIGGGFEGGRV